MQFLATCLWRICCYGATAATGGGGGLTFSCSSCSCAPAVCLRRLSPSKQGHGRKVQSLLKITLSLFEVVKVSSTKCCYAMSNYCWQVTMLSSAADVWCVRHLKDTFLMARDIFKTKSSFHGLCDPIISDKKKNPGCLPQIKGKHVSATCCVMPSMFVWQGISLPAKQYLISCDKVQSWHIGPPLACLRHDAQIYMLQWCTLWRTRVHIVLLWFSGRSFKSNCNMIFNAGCDQYKKAHKPQN